MADDLVIAPRRGIPHGLTIPGGELRESFSRSSGPGGQGVNTTDSRVELRWDVAASAALSDGQRLRLLAELGPRLTDGLLSVVASEHRAQLQNRNAARARLANLITAALAPPPPARRPTKPSRSARAKRLQAKQRRSKVKSNRRRPPEE